MKEKLIFFNIKMCAIVFALVLFLIIPAYAATEPIEIKVNSPSQVIPGTIFHIQVSIINSQIKDEKKVTINEINYDNPFQLTEKTTISQQVSAISSNVKNKNKDLRQLIDVIQYSISKPKQEKKSVNKKFSPIGNALKQREYLNTEFNNRIKTEKLSDEEIKSYIKSEDDLKTKISDGMDFIYIDIPVPKDFPEDTTLTIPVNVSYSTDLLSNQIFSTFATVTVTSNPVPKRAIIIDIDGAKKDALYNSLSAISAMPNMLEIVNNGVRFTNATTVFPSITLAAQASIFTGNYPKNHKIAGNSWFDRSIVEWRKYGLDTYTGDGQQNEDLSTNVDTIYEAAKKDRNMDSTVIYNQYSRNRINDGATTWITPGASEYLANYINHDFPKIDSSAMENALWQLSLHPDRAIMTIYLSGLDGNSHFYGPNGVGHNQESYLIQNVDGQIGRLINGGCAWSTELGCLSYYPGLKNMGIMAETVIIVVSDHGQISVTDDFRITKGELEQKLLNIGYDIDDQGPLEGSYNAVAATNGGMAQIYIRNPLGNWSEQPSLLDLATAAETFSNLYYVDTVLVRYLYSNGYKVYTDGNIQDLETFFAGKADYIDAVNRIKGLDSDRSGDIILLAKYSDGWYFDDPASFPTPDQLLLGEHGGLSPDESYIPLIFSGPTIRKGADDPTPARNIDMAKTLADLLGFSMPNADGVILPVQDNFGYRMKDSNTPGGPAYDWIDITSTGTKILPDSDDNYTSGLPVGFFFNFYGTDYSHVSITNNGIVLASGGTGQYINQPIGSSTPHNFISPFWDDLVTWDTAGDIYYKTIGTAPNRMFVVEWHDNQHYTSSTSGVTFEAILYEGTNNIKFQYKDMDFGTVSDSTSFDLPPYNNGGSATVGIEGPDGRGLQYSYNRQVINPELAILFKFPAFSGTNMHLSKNAPANMNRGNEMIYTLYYNNFGSMAASHVLLEDTLPSNVEFVSASDGGTYDSAVRKIKWNIGSVPAFPSGRGFRTITARIPSSVPVGAVIQNTASISTGTLETRYDDNSASASTKITESNLPPDTSIFPIIGISGGTPSVDWNNSTIYSYQSCPTATGVGIRIHINDTGVDIIGSMAGGPSSWTYTAAPFYPRHGAARITYSVSGCAESSVLFNIYIDPAGYIYDAGTGMRISGASVWLERPDESGEWENVPIGAFPNPIMQPDMNPLITGEDGQYQWDVLEGSYRVHVEAPGYYPADSIVVSIPPVVTNLHVGLTRIIVPDSTPPNTTIALSGTFGNNNWYISDVEVNLAAVDNEDGTGVNRIEYSFDNAVWTTYSANFTITAEGTTAIYYRSIDNANNAELAKSQTIYIDKTLPEIIINSPVVGSNYILNQVISADWSADDSLSGIASITATVPNGSVIDTATVGNKTFSANAIDNASNQANEIINYNVVYNYSGLFPPIKDSIDAFKIGSAIPIKFQLQDADGTYIANAVASIYLENITDGIAGGEIAAISSGKANTSNQFRYDSAENQYIFNLATKLLSKGNWRIRISLDDGTSKYATIYLK